MERIPWLNLIDQLEVSSYPGAHLVMVANGVQKNALASNGEHNAEPQACSNLKYGRTQPPHTGPGMPVRAADYFR